MQPTPVPQKINMIFTFDEMNLILKGLGKLPAEESYDIIGKIHAHWNKLQLDQQEKEKKDAEEKAKQNGKTETPAKGKQPPEK